MKLDRSTTASRNLRQLVAVHGELLAKKREENLTFLPPLFFFPLNPIIISPPIIPQKGMRVKTRKSKSTPAWMPDAFEAFWNLYRTRGRSEDRVGAVREWDRLKPDEALIQTMTQALETQSRSETWRRGIGIPYACRWLKNERGKDTTPERSESDQEAEPPRRRYVGKRIIDGQEVDVYE